jgi:hypothetical protein
LQAVIAEARSISGLVAEYIVAIDVTRVRFPADATLCLLLLRSMAPYPLSLALKALSVKAQNANEHKPSSIWLKSTNIRIQQTSSARLAQSAERKALNLVVVGSSPTVGVCHCLQLVVGFLSPVSNDLGPVLLRS